MKTRRFTSAPSGSMCAISRHERGFALLVTLSLMILLVVIGVGMLTLASITLRSSGHEGAMAKARANARMGLMMALGDLQKNAGPDQRITARADIDPENIGKPRITGVWNSRNFQASAPPTANDYTKAERNKKFAGWLTSSPNGKDSGLIDFAKSQPTDGAVLWGAGSLAAKNTTVPVGDMVSASKIQTKPSRGAVAWAVMDEGVKVRINTPYVEMASTKGRQTTQLGSGGVPNTAAIPSLSKLKGEFFEQGSEQYVSIQKGISRLNFGLAAETIAAGTGELLKPLTHDVTPSSMGIFTDTAAGGLKEDINLLTNTNILPTEYAGKGIYASRLGMAGGTAPSDPKWESFRDFARIYRDTNRLVASGGVPVMKLQAPAGWNAAITSGTTTIMNPAPPPGVVLLPTIAKVQIVFSLIGRDLYSKLPAGEIKRRLTSEEKLNNLHNPQDGHYRNTKYDYDLHLLYTPVVTLHNPYNVALEFNTLKLEFLNVPFSMKVFRNGTPQSLDFVNLESMYGDNRSGSKDKVFGMEIKTKAAGKVGVATVRLLPGEVKLFSPYIDPARTYADEMPTTGKGMFWDIYVGDGKTNSINAIPGWRGDGIGFDCDNITGGYAIDGTAENGRWESGIGLAWDDEIAVEFKPSAKSSSRTPTKFVVKMTAKVGTSTTPAVVSAIEMNYENGEGLTNFLGANGASMPMRYPRQDASPNHIKAWEMIDRSTTPISGLSKLKPFALLSLQAKTTSGAKDATDAEGRNEDGRLATKPWSFAHPNIGASSQMVLSQHSANFSHEIDLQPLDGSTANHLTLDAQDRSSFVAGHTTQNGVKFGTQYDIPIAPLQTLSSLNGANPGGSSGYLPRFAAPIGNSWAHPLLDPSLISTPSPVASGTGYAMVDHSFLLNSALYDHFYFSGFADQTVPFDPGNSVATLADIFSTGGRLVDPRVSLYNPDGRASAELADMLAGTNPHSKIAAWQMMDGAFNINSTSVAAWKAMLGSIRDSKSIINKLNKAAGTSSLVNLAATNTSSLESRISRFRLPASESASDGADVADGYWLGPREYSDQELERLAIEIVKQVRERGPFLSMSEFVNRRLGPASDEKAQRGALQQAIDNAGLNQGMAASAGAGFEISESAVANYKYNNPKAGAGPSYQGAPGYLTQADLLSVLGNAATPRSDTFTIRAYGEAQDGNGKITANAVCEAVVQRVPDYVDGADKADIQPAALTSNMNKIFGRRFTVVSFRWLGNDEI